MMECWCPQIDKKNITKTIRQVWLDYYREPNENKYLFGCIEFWSFEEMCHTENCQMSSLAHSASFVSRSLLPIAYVYPLHGMSLSIHTTPNASVFVRLCIGVLVCVRVFACSQVFVFWQFKLFCTVQKQFKVQQIFGMILICISKFYPMRFSK